MGDSFYNKMSNNCAKALVGGLLNSESQVANCVGMNYTVLKKTSLSQGIF